MKENVQNAHLSVYFRVWFIQINTPLGANILFAYLNFSENYIIQIIIVFL